MNTVILFNKQEKSSSFLFNLPLAVLTGKMNTRGITGSEGKHLRYSEPGPTKLDGVPRGNSVVDHSRHGQPMGEELLGWTFSISGEYLRAGGDHVLAPQKVMIQKTNNKKNQTTKQNPQEPIPRGDHQTLLRPPGHTTQKEDPDSIQKPTLLSGSHTLPPSLQEGGEGFTTHLVLPVAMDTNPSPFIPSGTGNSLQRRRNGGLLTQTRQWECWGRGGG